MTDETTTEPVEETEAQPDVTEGSAPKELREAYKRSQAENKTLKARLVERTFEDAGLDRTKGIGKAIAKEYDGEMTVDALKTYATEEYEVEFVEAPENKDAPAIHQGTRQLDQVQSDSASSVPLTESEALKKASSEGDLVTAGNIKVGRLRKLIEP